MKYAKYIILNIILLTILLIVTSGYLLNAKTLVVTSNSMKPFLTKGNLIIIFKNDKYEVGDVISFTNMGQIITHRLVQKNAIDEDGRFSYQTKGDANNSSDQMVILEKNIIGKVEYVIPFIGYFINFLQSKYFIYLVLVFIAIGLVGKILYVKK